MSTYEFLLFGHLLFVIAWVGTDIGVQVLSLRARRASGQRQIDFMADTEWLGTRLLIPSALLVVIFGALLVGEVGYDFGDTWIVLGLAGFAFSFIAGAGFLGPETGRLAGLAAERGADDPDVRRRIDRIFLVSRIELVILIGIVLDMVVKPGL
jgi:uncharacterized membrane protein